MNEFMTRLIVVLMLLLFVVCMGCNSTTAIPTPGTHTPLIASVAGLVTASDGTPAPNPPTPPGPVPSGFCENCGGDGELGDKTIKLKCPVCGGDGRTDNEPPTAPNPREVPRVDLVPPIASYDDAVKAFDGMCENGQCNQPTANVRRPATNVQESAPQRRGLFGRRRGGGGG